MAWYNSSWLYRQKITVDATQVDEVFSLLPIYTSKLNMHYFDHAKAGAADIRITRADGTTEVARYAVAHDATARTGCIIANVLADVSISTNTDYYVYYGNSAASDYATTDTYGRDAAFGDYDGAYMPGMTTADLTGAGRDLTAYNTPGTAASGYEGITAASYNGTDEYHGYDGTQAVTSFPLTMEALAYSTSTTAAQCAISYTDTSGTANQVAIRLRGDLASSPSTDPVRFLTVGNGGGTPEPGSAVGYSASTWYYMAGKRTVASGSGDTVVYLDGGNSGTTTTSVNAASARSKFRIGVLDVSSRVNYLAGRVAVALISDSSRSADYIATMQDAWSSSTFWTAGVIETEFGGMTGWRLFQTATTTTASGSHQDWSNPSNALSVNADAATAVLDETTWLLSETLKLTNPDYGITIPSGESSYDCEFRIARTGQTSSAKEIRDYNIQFIDNTGTLVGTNLADTGTVWPASATNADYTVAGVSLTDTKFDADTGIAIQADGTNTNGATTASVITGWINVIWDSSGATTGGDGALTLPAPLEISGAGSVPVVGTGALSLPATTLSGAGSVLVAGSGNLDLPIVEIIGSGGNAAITGTGNLNLPVIDLAGAGSVVIVGSGNIDIPVIEIDGAETPTTTGWFLFQNATTVAATLPTVTSWINPSNALDEDASVANASLSMLGPASYRSGALSVRNPIGISIPSGVQITSIDYKIVRYMSGGTGTVATDYIIRPIKGGSADGDNIASPDAWTSDPEEIIYSEGLMGLTWGANDFGSDFGISIDVSISKTEFNGSAYIESVWGRINYSPVNPLGGTGALELPSITLDTPPNPTGGTATLELPLFTMKGHSYNALCSCCEGYTMRTLIELRRMLVQQSGHAELVADYENEDWADNGADHFIQAGQRFCDDQFQYHKSEAWFYAALAAGESLVTFTNARIIKQVWLNYTGGNRVLLERLTLDKMREEYTEPLLSDETQGTPAYWVPAVLGLAPQQYTETALSFDADGITDHNLIMFGNHYPYKGIYIMPPADGDYTIEIKAEWYSYEMCEDSDVSFWSQYPELILMAARRQMEIDLHRNSTGAQDFEAPLMRSLMKLSHNLVAEEWSGPTKVRGEC